MKKENKEVTTTWQKIKWWFNFLTTILMNSVIVILIMVGIMLGFYLIDLMINDSKGITKPPLYGAYVIVSPSMEPVIHVQDAIVIHRDDELKIGDVCTYLSKDPRWYGIKITHRIIAQDVDADGKKVYIFKGDANNVQDALPVYEDQIFGKVIMRIPKIGFIQYFLSQAYGWVIAIVVPCIGLITFDVIKIVKTSRQRRRIKRGVTDEE